MADAERLADEMDVVSGKRRGGGKGGPSRRPGGGMSRQVQLSKALSKLLRHRASEAGIALDDEGYAPLDQVGNYLKLMQDKLAYGPIKSLGATVDEVKAVVADNDKQRFSLRAEGEREAPRWLIRANQGHSIKLESSALLEPVTVEAGNVPSRVVHGTYFAFWPAIVASGGLKPMGRNHVHCCVGTPEEGVVVSGMRGDAELLVEIDVEKSLGRGVRWWRSDNGVMLTEGDGDEGVLSTDFFKRVTGRRVDVGVLWEDGEMRGSLPEGIRARVPQGKARRRGG